MFVAGRDLRFAKGRFLLMGAVVALITLLVVLLSGLTEGLGRESTSAIDGLPVDHVAFGAPAPGMSRSFATSTVDDRQLLGWRTTPGVTAAEPLAIATVTARARERAAAVAAFGVARGSHLAPGGSVPSGSVVLSSAAADAVGVTPGGWLTVAGRRLRVDAVRGDASFSHAPVVWMGLDDWRAVVPRAAAGTGAADDEVGAAGEAGATDARRDTAGDGVEAATVIGLRTSGAVDVAAADRALGTQTVTRAGARSAIGSYTSENGSLQLMRVLLLAISALVIGAFFTVWTVQRSGDVAVLGALGATTGYLLRDALGQAVTLLVLGIGVGTAVAIGAGTVVGDRVPLVLDLGTVLGSAAALAVLGVLGAALAIGRVTGVDPQTALGSAR